MYERGDRGEQQYSKQGEKPAHRGCHSMNVPEAASRRTRVRLPADVDAAVRGLRERRPAGGGQATSASRGGRSSSTGELKTEGKLGFWRWLSMWVGVAGTYRQNDSVDVVYQRNGKPVVATKLPLEPLA